MPALQCRVEENGTRYAFSAHRSATASLGNASMTLIPHRCGPRRYGPLLAATFLLAAALGPLAFAQQAPQGPSRGPTPPSPKGPAAPARDSQPATDSALRQRVEQLEEQLVDMQVAVGTLESLARGTAASPGAGGGRQGAYPTGAIGAADAGRLDSIETQIRALAAQLEHVQEQVRALSARTGELTVPGGQVAG